MMRKYTFYENVLTFKLKKTPRMTVQINLGAFMSHPKELGFSIVVCMPLWLSTKYFYFCFWHEDRSGYIDQGHKIGSRSISFGQSPLDPRSTHKSFIFHRSHSIQVSEIEPEKQKKTQAISWSCFPRS